MCNDNCHSAWDLSVIQLLILHKRIPATSVPCKQCIPSRSCLERCHRLSTYIVQSALLLPKHHSSPHLKGVNWPCSPLIGDRHAELVLRAAAMRQQERLCMLLRHDQERKHEKCFCVACDCGVYVGRDPCSLGGCAALFVVRAGVGRAYSAPSLGVAAEQG
jgi:hypothetical protein